MQDYANDGVPRLSIVMLSSTHCTLGAAVANGIPVWVGGSGDVIVVNGSPDDGPTLVKWLPWWWRQTGLGTSHGRDTFRLRTREAFISTHSEL